MKRKCVTELYRLFVLDFNYWKICPESNEENSSKFKSNLVQWLEINFLKERQIVRIDLSKMYFQMTLLWIVYVNEK